MRARPAFKCILAAALALVVVAVAACGGANGGAVATVAAAPGAPGDWPTYHRDSARAGAAPVGPALAHPGRIWRVSVDGRVYAEPLAVGGRVIVATENDSLYALDAQSGHVAWRTHVGTPVPGGDLPCGDIDPSGITSTPVADPGAGVVYAVSFERPGRHMLSAVDLASGRVRWRRVIDPPGSNPSVEQERAALSLSRGRVYVPYGGLYGDCGNYHGYVVSAGAAGPGGRLVSYRVPTHREGGIWTPSGAAIDAAGNVYVVTGNGDASHFDFGNSVIRLSPGLRRTGFFAPRNSGANNLTDTDLGSVGPLLLPHNRLFAIGKDGIGYLLSTRRLGGIGHPLASRHLCKAAFGGLAYAGGRIFIPCTSGIVAARPRGAAIRSAWHGPSFRAGPPIVAGGAVWTIDLDANVLYALDARTGRARFHAGIGDAAQFSTPAAGGGRVYVGAGDQVEAFGG